MPRAKKTNGNVELAVMANDIKYIKEEVKEIKGALGGQYVTRIEFEPIKKVVYAIIGLILTAVIGAVISLVIR